MYGKLLILLISMTLSFALSAKASSFGVLLIGETGAGKSSAIVTLDNLAKGKFEGRKDYIINLGGEEEESFQSQTKEVTAYPISYEGDDFRFIDTPGFGDTRGISDDENFSKVERFLDSESINAVVIVIRSGDCRASSPLKNVKSKLSSLFESSVDFKKHTFLLVTHSDDRPNLSAAKKVAKFYNIEENHIFYFSSAPVQSLDDKDEGAIAGENRLWKRNRHFIENLRSSKLPQIETKSFQKKNKQVTVFKKNLEMAINSSWRMAELEEEVTNLEVLLEKEKAKKQENSGYNKKRTITTTYHHCTNSSGSVCETGLTP